MAGGQHRMRGAWSELRLGWAWCAVISLILAACTPQAPVPGKEAGASGPNDKHMLAVLVAGDASITAFDDATGYLRDKLVERGVPDAQIHMLSARSDRPDGVEPARLQTAIARLDALRPASDGSCLVYLTSHGAPDAGFYLDDDDALMPPILDRALATGCGSVPTVVIVSACYSGQFAAAPMLRPNRIILTAAAADRSSFGCEAGATYTFSSRNSGHCPAYHGGTFVPKSFTRSFPHKNFPSAASTATTWHRGPSVIATASSTAGIVRDIP